MVQYRLKQRSFELQGKHLQSWIGHDVDHRETYLLLPIFIRQSQSHLMKETIGFCIQ